MKFKKGIARIYIFCLLFSGLLVPAVAGSVGKPVWRRKRRYIDTNKARYIKNLFQDLLELNLQLLSVDTYTILASFFPFYIGSRMVDYPIHQEFYCKVHHRNKNQMHCWCDHLARFGLAVPIVGLGSLAFFAKDKDLRLTSWVFILGMPLLVFGNKITKKIQFEGCYRPWNEHFSCVKRAPGGFPSGHAAYVTYMTVLYGLRYGRSWAIPLGLYSIFVGINFFVCNRHYVSQIVAGIGLGTMYAFAANQFIDSKIARSVHGFCGLDPNGGPGIGISYSF